MPNLPKKIVELFKKYKDAAKRNKVHEELTEEEREVLEKFDLITRDLQRGNGHAYPRYRHTSDDKETD